MSNFTYPPPPPPPPADVPPPSQPYQSSQRGGRRIPSFQDHNGRGRRPDGRGTYAGSRGQHHHSSQNRPPPSGRDSSGMPAYYPPAYAQANYTQHGYPSVEPQFTSTPVGWSAAPAYAYPPPTNVAQSQQSNQYAPSASQHPAQGSGPAGYPNGHYAVAAHSYAPPYTSHAHIPAQITHNPAATFGLPSNPQMAFANRAMTSQTFVQHQASHNTGDGHGQKRKREQSPHRAYGKGNHTSPCSHQASAKAKVVPVNKPKVLTAPSVPSFGFHALPPRPPPVNTSVRPDQKDHKDRKQQKKRKTNQLGLTPKGDVHENTDEEVDEEAAFSQSGAPQLIEFRGKTVSISTAAEIQAWIAERRKKYPTAARVAERKAQQDARKKQAEERRKQQSAEQKKSARPQEKKGGMHMKKNKMSDANATTAEKHGPALSKEEVQRKKLEKHLRKAEKLRSMLEQSDIKDKGPEPVDAIAAEKTAAAVESSSSGSESSDSDAAPDIETSKPSKKAKMSADRAGAGKRGRSDLMAVPCKYFVRDGHCRRKHCRFLHAAPPAPAKKTLYDRLREQDVQLENQQLLAIVKQLGDGGFLDAT